MNNVIKLKESDLLIMIKKIINEKKSKITEIFDIDEAERKVVGSGTTHNVYSTKFSIDYYIKKKLNDGDIVVKMGNPENIKYYAKEFMKHPDIFPIVYKVGINKKIDKSDKNAYMFIENLDTNNFLQNMNMLSEYLLKELKNYMLDYIDDIDGITFIITNDETQLDKDENKLKKIINEHMKNAKNKNLKKTYDDLVEVTRKINTLINNGEINDFGHDRKLTDLGADYHKGNFAMTKDGKIKCIDF